MQIFSLKEDIILTTEELNYAYLVWKTFPDHIIGFQSRSHFWDDTKVFRKNSDFLITND